MNSVEANVNNQNNLTAFKAKAGNRKAIHEFIDKNYDLTMEFINRNRPAAENRMRTNLRTADDLDFNRIMKKVLKDIFIDKPADKIKKMLFKM